MTNTERFKDRMMERSYQHALISHAVLYRNQGSAGASRSYMKLHNRYREAYSRGYRGDMTLYTRTSLAHAYYAAGKHNAKLGV